MEFAADIALGGLSESDLEDLPKPGEREGAATTRRTIQISLLYSVGIHLALAATAVYFIAGDIRSIEERPSASFTVQFVSRNPQIIPAEADPDLSVEADQRATPSVIDEAIPRAVEAEQPTTQQNLNELAEAGQETGEAAPVANTPIREEAPPVVPSVESLRSVITSLQRSDEASPRNLFDCNRLERDSEFIKCGSPAGDSDREPTTNPVYRALNPSYELSRSRATVTTIAGRSAGIADALSAGSLPAGLSAYVLEEIEQSIELYSNSSNRSLNHMNRMVDKSFAGEESRRVFDTWVQQQSQELRNRRVTD